MVSGDTRFFQSQRKGEIAEWRDELQRTDLETQKLAVKKVIAAMTVGKDVSGLFPEMVQCMQTTNLELKKLVYLYLINYAKSRPELAILAVNTFIKDSQDTNPLVRALAVRTMGCIRVHRITEYLCDPLQCTLKDSDPYVRKTAVLCVAKLFSIDAELVESRGFLVSLCDILRTESNAIVVSNAVAALSEISHVASKDIVAFDVTILHKLLNILTDCTEWGQVYVLDAIAKFQCSTPDDKKAILEQVGAHLQHSNGAVVLASVNVLLVHLKGYDGSTLQHTVKSQIASSLVTLLGTEKEIQFVTLEKLQSLLPDFSNVLQKHLQVFFCKYNDPFYIKQAKLRVIMSLVTIDTVETVLSELKEYASEVDLDFVRQSVRAISSCAVRFEIIAEVAVQLLLELIGSQINYVVQEAIIAMKDIIRCYPNRFEHSVPVLCDALSTLDQPDAKAALIWMIGEYAPRIDNVNDLMEVFADSFMDEADTVQLQLITSAVKSFLKQKDIGSQNMAQHLLRVASNSENPDVRDRAFIYWRLLSSNTYSIEKVII